MNPRELRFRFPIHAPRGEVWKTLSTEEGLKSFFSPNINVEMKVGGAFEILFSDEEPQGQRGSEGMIILALEEERLLSFTWNAPPTIPSVRHQRTVVHVYLEDRGLEETEILFVNSGYGAGEEWQKARDYFHRAWGRIVLPRLKSVIEEGPYDWENAPEMTPIPLSPRL